MVNNTKINTFIRVNLQNDDTDEFMKIITFFKSRYPNHPHLLVSPAFLITNQIMEQQDCRSDKLFGEQDKIRFELDIAEKLMEQNMENNGLHYPSNSFNECSVRNENIFGIGPGGKLYKCWENIGNKELCYGVLEADGNVKVTDFNILNRYLHAEDPLSDPKCQKCRFFPISWAGARIGG